MDLPLKTTGAANRGQQSEKSAVLRLILALYILKSRLTCSPPFPRVVRVVRLGFAAPGVRRCEPQLRMG